jgi:hypothetical protein
MRLQFRKANLFTFLVFFIIWPTTAATTTTTTVTTIVLDVLVFKDNRSENNDFS